MSASDGDCHGGLSVRDAGKYDGPLGVLVALGVHVM